MPIKGLTDKLHITPSFPCIGKLRKGGVKPERGPGKDLDHFRFTSDNPAIAAAFIEAYGNAPTQIRCYLADTDGLDSWYESWVGGGLVRRCDGERLVLDREGTNYKTYEARPYDQRPPCLGCPNGKLGKDGCSPVGRIKLVIHELLASGFVGYVTVETHSIHDLMELSANIEMAEAIAPLQKMPLVLSRVARQISCPDAGDKRVRRTKHLLQLQPSAEWVRARLSRDEQQAFASVQGRTLPPAEPLALPAHESGRSENYTLTLAQEIASILRTLRGDLDPQDYKHHGNFAIRKIFPDREPESATRADLPKIAAALMAVHAMTASAYVDDFNSALQLVRDWLSSNPVLKNKYAAGEYQEVAIAWVEFVEDQIAKETDYGPTLAESAELLEQQAIATYSQEVPA